MNLCELKYYLPTTRLLFVLLYFQLVQWINDAGMAEGVKKVNLLRKIIEVLLHQGSQFVPLYIQNILSFGGDKSNDVKKQVIVFIEEIRLVRETNKFASMWLLPRSPISLN